MKTIFLLAIIFFLSDSTYSQDYSLKIYNSITNKKTYYRNTGDKVKIWTTNINGKERLAKSRISWISKDSIDFSPRSDRYRKVVTHIRNLDYIEIRTPGMIITSYSLAIFGILTSAITRHPPSFWTAYRRINFNDGKWAKEIIQKEPGK